MEYNRQLIKVLLNEIPCQSISIDCFDDNSLNYADIDENEFLKYAQKHLHSYSITEQRAILTACLSKENIHTRETTTKTIFELIEEVADEYLTIKTDQHKNIINIVYKSDHCLGWRDLVRNLGDDIFVASILKKDYKPRLTAYVHPESTWDESNDSVVYAENHAHLKASCRTFDLNWIALMNSTEEFTKAFSKMRVSLAAKLIVTNDAIQINSLKDDCAKAALYRAYLWACIIDSTSIINILEGIIVDIKIDKGSNIFNILSPFIQTLKNKKTELNKESLRTFDEFDYIDIVAILDMYNALFPNFASYVETEPSAIIFSEKYFLAACLSHISLDEFSWFQTNIFYRYLILKNRFRNELIQCNNVFGLENFSLYQDRKAYFYHNNPAIVEKEIAKLTFGESLRTERKIKYLEERIMPSKNLKKTILGYLTESNCIYEKLNQENKDAYFVIHFRKENNNKVDGASRFFKLQNDLKNQATQLSLFLNDKDVNHYIRGIDACSKEVGCRPEVFGPVFRQLLSLRFNANRSGKSIDEEKGHYILATYHVGEDFLDLIDGLRAIDEALRFCCVNKGCRLGHALALGINPQVYYKNRNYMICLSKQDYLDNLVWLYGKGKEYKLNLTSYYLLFKSLKTIVQSLSKEIGYSYSDIDLLYQAWFLRGDDPKYYSFDKYQVNNPVSTTDQSINKSDPLFEKIRSNLKARQLTYEYHYSSFVFENGRQLITLDIRSMKQIIPFINIIQNKLMAEIQNREISIEANPSSNLAISTIERYDEHPILRFNSFGLSPSPLNSLCVSINTDDLGVFDTFLENEYFIMEQAVSKATNPNGKLKYGNTKAKIWIERIRQNGIDQAFDFTKLV